VHLEPVVVIVVFLGGGLWTSGQTKVNTGARSSTVNDRYDAVRRGRYAYFGKNTDAHSG